ncbi:MAG: PDZ domain-containing protein [Acidobacteriota bacterium]
MRFFWLLLMLGWTMWLVPGGWAPLRADTAPTPSSTTAANGLDEASMRDALRRTIATARDRVFPALVSIEVVTVEYGGGREFKGGSTGSGTVIDDRGHVLTNQHVTRNGRSYTCTLGDKRRVEADLVGEDPLTDLAVLRLRLPPEEAAALVAAPFGDSGALQIGDYVLAMGSPFSLSRSVSLGIVSNTERVFAGGFGSDDLQEMELESGQRTGLFTRWIQHDALINPGNSGGPLVNLAGEVVGVNELGGSAMGFAIPSNLSQRVAADLIAHGAVPRSWLGLTLRPIERTGYDRGALIASVVDGGPAAAAGVEVGDVLTAIDGEPVTVRFPEEVPLVLDRLAQLAVDAPVTLGLLRPDPSADAAAAEPRSVTATPQPWADDIGARAAFHAWGFTGQAITDKMARDRRLDGNDGVLITGVRAGGPAQQAEPSLRAGDVLYRLEDGDVGDLDGLIARYETLLDRADDEPPLLLAFDRRGRRHLTLLQPRREAGDDPPRELPKAWLGVATQPVWGALAERLGVDDARGFRVTRVYPDSAAAGQLQVGDIITAVDDVALEPASAQDAGLLGRQIRGLDIGAETALTLLRDGAIQTVTVPLGRTRIAADEARRHRDPDFEFAVRELTFFDRDENRWSPDVRGVMVEQVESGGWASLGGLRPGDLIQRIGGEPITGLRSFRRAMADVRSARAARVAVVVLRGARTHDQYLEPEWGPRDERP